MNSINLLNKAKLASCLFHPRFNIHSNLYNGFPKVSSLQPVNVLYKHVKCISHCSLMQSSDSDSSRNKENNEKLQKIIEDKEFQSILQDFAKDFGVDNDSNKVLEDIRRNVNISHEEDNLAAEDDTTSCSVSVSTIAKGFPFKFKEFSDRDSSVIHSYEEQYDPFEETDEFYHIDQELKPNSLYADLKRGISGVFDLHELVDVLRKESLLDVTAISIPKELHYADFLVLATAKSERHNEAVSELIIKLYKQKKNMADPFIKIEGEKTSNWKAIDMGNIVLHIFLEETRALYDIESLWLLDSDYDSGGNLQPDPMLKILEEQMEFFNSMQNLQSTISKENNAQESCSPKDIS